MKQILFLLILLFTHGVEADSTISAVSNGSCKSRFGDALLAYTKAKWLAYKYDLVFLYNPFTYSNQLLLHTLELKESDYAASYKMRSDIKDEMRVSITRESGTLYVSDYYDVLVDWYNWDEGLFPKVYDKVFIDELKRVIQSNRVLQEIAIPTDCISVAVHIRKGGGFDLPLLTDQKKIDPKAIYVDVAFPLKFPPDEYYIEQIVYLADLFKDKKLFVFLFTDDRNPEKLAKTFAKAINRPSIAFGYRNQGNAHNANVLDDFFAMTHFDCLIRGDSSFSKAAQLISDYRVVICPVAHHWEGTTLIIDKVNTFIDACVNKNYAQ